MAITALVKAAMRDLSKSDPLLHAAAKIALDSCTPLAFDFNGIVAYRAMMDKLRSFERSDIRWHLAFMAKHPALRNKLLGTIIRLNAKQYHLHLARLRELWARITSISGVTTDTAWNVLIGYPNADPGTTRSQATAVFMLNTVILDMIQETGADSHEEGVLTEPMQVAESDDGSTFWELEALTEEMTEFAFAHAHEIDRVVAIVTRNKMWQPAAIQYMLRGELPSTGDEADVLLNALVSDVCSTKEEKLQLSLNEAPNTTMRVEDILGVNRSHTIRQLATFSRARRNNDIELLRLYKRLLPSFIEDDAVQRARSLTTLVEELRNAGQEDVVSAIDTGMLGRAAEMTSKIAFESVRKNTRLSAPEITPARRDRFSTALRLAYAVGTPPIIEYLEDHERAMNLIAERGIDTYTDLIRLIDEFSNYGALSEGVL